MMKDYEKTLVCGAFLLEFERIAFSPLNANDELIQSAKLAALERIRGMFFTESVDRVRYLNDLCERFTVSMREFRSLRDRCEEIQNEASQRYYALSDTVSKLDTMASHALTSADPMPPHAFDDARAANIAAALIKLNDAPRPTPETEGGES